MKVYKSNPSRKKIVSNRLTKTNRAQQWNFMGIDFDSLLRLIMLWLVLITGASGLAWRLYKLQILQEVTYQKTTKDEQTGKEIVKTITVNLPERAQQQQTSSIRPYIPRRSVVDSNGNVISLDRVVYDVYIHPQIVREDNDLKEEASENRHNLDNLLADKLAKILTDKDKNQILKLLNSKNTGVILAKSISENQANRIKRLSLDGVDYDRRYSRFYPQGELFADVIGYVNQDRQRQGQAGIEYSQQDLLQRELSELEIKAMTTVRRDGQGAFIPHSLPEGVVKIDDLQLQLTLDLRLQRAVRDSLKEQIKKFKAKRGLTIVMDVDNGEIVALACEPTFDPNKYFNYDYALFKNWGVTDSYEPGSTFKPINVAIALDEGVIQPDSIVLDAPSVQIDGWPISNASKKGLGWVSITKVLEISSNTAMIYTMEKLNKNKYYQRLKELGLNKKMGIDMPFEATGYLKPKDIFTARQIEPAVSSFGQGLSLTPLKLVQLHAALANGGTLVTPHVVRGLVDTQGKLQSKLELKIKRIFSTNSALNVVRMMQSVVANGSGKAAITDGYYVGGKTGTAQKASDTGSYIPNAKITSFVSIFPTDKPRYVILSVIDEPQGANTYGSTVAAPIVKQVIDALIAIKGIPPSYPLGQKKN